MNVLLWIVMHTSDSLFCILTLSVLGLWGHPCPCQLWSCCPLVTAVCRGPKETLRGKQLPDLRGKGRQGRLVVEKCGCESTKAVGKRNSSLLWGREPRLTVRERKEIEWREREMSCGWLGKAQWSRKAGELKSLSSFAYGQHWTFASSVLHD